MAGQRRFVDLHAHSTASDGSLSPRQVVALADRRQLSAVALTDHDTIDGLAEAQTAATNHPDLKVVLGIEVSARWPSGTLHLLGLGVAPDGPAIGRLSAAMLAARNDRNPKILARLRELGVPIDISELLAIKRDQPQDQAVLGRLHMAQLLVAKRVVRSIKEAFDRYLGAGGAAYVDKERLEPAEVIRWIHAAGGLAVLAHPVQIGCQNGAQLRRAVKDFADEGLDGIEVYHTDHNERQTRQYLELARHFGLGITGGSDFHGHGKPEAILGKPPVPLAALSERFREKLLG